ncbi:MAG: hypothetical protein ACLP6G_22875 [Terriglobales bacterium]
MSLSGLSGFRGIRRMIGIVLGLAGLLTLSGCWVYSVEPLYEVNPSTPDPDLAFDQTLIGSWSLTDNKCTTLLTIAAKDGAYDLQSAEQGEGCSGDKSHRQARLVKLDTHYFLDVSPMDDEVCDMCLAKHNIFLAKFDNATLALTPIDSDWLKKSITARTVTLATLADDTDTITASSKELKAFCRKYADNKAVFKPDSTGTFKRNPVSAAAGPG